MTRLTAQFDRPVTQVLTLQEAVRSRSGMYIGSTDSCGLLRLISWLIELPASGMRLKLVTTVEVKFNSDGTITVSHDGPGLPGISLYPDRPSMLEIAVTRNRIGDTAKELSPIYVVGDPFVSPLLYAVTNAISERFVIESRTYSGKSRFTCMRGMPTGPVEMIDSEPGQGLTVTFLPDSAIFHQVDFSLETIRERLDELAWLFSGLRICFQDERIGQSATFRYINGLAEKLARSVREAGRLHSEPIAIRGKTEQMSWEAALQFTDGGAEEIRSYVNATATLLHGTHVTGLRAAVSNSLDRVAKQTGASRVKLQRGAYRYGLVALISVQVNLPQYRGATRDRLANPEVRSIIASGARRLLDEYFDKNPEVAQHIIERKRIC